MRSTTAAHSLTVLALTLAAAAGARGQLEVGLDTEWATATDAVHADSEISAALGVKLEESWHVNSNQPLEDFLIPTVLELTPPAGITVKQVIYPEAILLESAMLGDQMAVFESEFVIWARLAVGGDVEPGRYAIPGTLQYQACNDVMCVAPQRRPVELALEVVPAETPLKETEVMLFGRPVMPPASDGEPVEVPSESGPSLPTAAGGGDCDVMAELEAFSIVGTAGGYMDVETFLEFLDGAEGGVSQQGMFEGKGPLVILLLIVLGGLLLNLTPCVLPLVPINLAIIGAGAQAGSRKRGFALGGMYGLAMALVYGVLGVLVALGLGTFGEINSTIWFNVAIAVLFVVLALAMFDIIHIDFSKYQGKLNVSGTAKQGTFALALFMGGVTALLAGACVAPVVIQVMVYSGDQYAKGSTFALSLPFFLGIGMALPWPFAGAGLSFLPKPGMWMVRVKQAMGLFILAFAAYYGYLGWEIYQHRQAAAAPGGGEDAAPIEEGWTGSICEGLATAKAEDKLVFIDMWATWCKNCLVMDKTTFRDEAVVERMADYVKVKFQAEDTSASPAKELLEAFNGVGLPTYAVLRPKGDEGGPM